MRHQLLLFLCGLVGASQLALAHTGVDNPAVLKRMHNMKDSADAVEILGNMAKGAKPFEAGAASDAKDALIALSTAAPTLFEAQETDPKMEARLEIWEQWDDFVERAITYQSAARGLDTTSLENLRATLPALGRACASCHETYRLEN